MRGERITITIRKPLADWFRKRAEEKGNSLSSELESSLDQFSTERVREGLKDLASQNKKPLGKRGLRG